MISNNECQTPQWLFDELNKEFNFQVDLCATNKNKKCYEYYYDYLTDCLGYSDELDIENNEGLFICGVESRGYNSCFMNPPYSDIYPFICKAWEDSRHCRIVCLLPSKTNTKWFRVFWHPIDCRGKIGCKVRFMPYWPHHKSKVSFIDPDTGKEQLGNNCGSMVVIMDRRSEYMRSLCINT